jgi:hypothetical protein
MTYSLILILKKWDSPINLKKSEIIYKADFFDSGSLLLVKG